MKSFYEKPRAPEPHLLWFMHGKLAIRPDEVVYMSCMENYTNFHLANGETFTSARTMKLYEQQLSTRGKFVRIHRKFLLNLSYLLGFEIIDGNCYACMSTGEKLVVSRRAKIHSIKHLIKLD